MYEMLPAAAVSALVTGRGQSLFAASQSSAASDNVDEEVAAPFRSIRLSRFWGALRKLYSEIVCGAAVEREMFLATAALLFR